eukprot:CAMPEP_0176360774 /NCGR_PEP_ID=MMETSP0126-20121128/17298_1 /TAXON_ID=141414 ORGANISM="Strombidinopsis acuminatum, Strain SPMC142" /NCGR_SAMPLE_ID=MMETSP0126 /ASSEMBLY_ACC=CAM_ASM_000229 /LENGTH=60 /DNA_ID=CAMNT_0017716095 /DNA_START=105 /DNA_END=287 /DNA_ORIENTATION=-
MGKDENSESSRGDATTAAMSKSTTKHIPTVERLKQEAELNKNNPNANRTIGHYVVGKSLG